MKHMAIITLIATTIAFFSGCAKGKPVFVHAKHYEVVDELPMDLKTTKRTGRMFSIVSNAQTADELAQTAMLAAYELHNVHGYDLTSVLLYPNKDLIRTGAYYAQVEYAADNKGTQGVPGVDKTLFTSGKWKVRAANNALSGRELAIINLWYGDQHKFPSKDMHSSLSFDKAALTDHIAKELEVHVAEVKLPPIVCREYKGLDVKSRMTPAPN